MGGSIDKEVPVRMYVEQHVGQVPIYNWHSQPHGNQPPITKKNPSLCKQPTYTLSPTDTPTVPAGHGQNGLSLAQQRVVPTPITLYQNLAKPSTIFSHRFNCTLLSYRIFGHLASKLRTKSYIDVTRFWSHF